MKNYAHKKVTFGSVLGCVLMFALATAPGFGQFDAPPADESEAMYVIGRVDAKSERALNVNGHAIEITDSTVFSKNGELVSFAEISVGDDVTIEALRSRFGRLRAISVEVRGDESDDWFDD